MNKFFDEDIRLFLENSEHVFFEKITKNKDIKYKFKYDNICIKEPTHENETDPLFPSEARNKNLSYNTKLLARVTQLQEMTDIITGEKSVRVIGEPEDNILIANLPVMIRSKYCSLSIYKDYDKSYCRYDPGGDFIIKGSPKVIICQDKMIENKPLVFIKNESGSDIHTVQVNSRSYKPNGITQIISIKIKKDNNITIRVPIFAEINVFILFRALGIEQDKSIIDYICNDEKDSEMIDKIRMGLSHSKTDKEHIKIQTQEQAIEYLSGKLKVLRKYIENEKTSKINQKRLHILALLQNNFLPHVEANLTSKAYYLGYMLNKLLKCSLGRVPEDDRDSYVNKRIELPGDLLMDPFKQFYRQMLNECSNFFKKRYTSDDTPLNIINQIKPNRIEQGISAALLLGTFSRKSGVAQMKQQLSYLQGISFMRRVDTPVGDSKSKLTGPRYLHPSSASFLCCASTPEHAKVGLTKHLALIASITIMQLSQIEMIKKFLKNKIVELKTITPLKIRNTTKVFLNGEWLGIVKDAISLNKELRLNKQNGYFDPTMSIVWDIQEKEIRVYCDGGRMFRPVMKVKNNQVKLTKELLSKISLNKSDSMKDKITSWEEFMIKYPDVIEYIDMEEQPYLMIADKIANVEKMRLQMIESIEKAKDIKTNETVNRYHNDYLYIKYTHCEFHPSFLLGEIVTTIPFSNHNYGVRNSYYYAQARQGMSIYRSDWRNTLDISYILYHVQKALILTRTSKYNYTDIMANGENVVVAIATYTGYNQEDSLIFNKSSIDRGLFRSTSLKKYISQIQKNQTTSQDDEFMKPDPSKVSGMKHGNYDKLNEKGYVPEETIIEEGDVIIGKVSPIQPVGNSTKFLKDSSEMYNKSYAPGVVDKVFTGIYNSEGYEIRKMRVRSERTPRIGDKFCIPDSVQTDILTENGWIDLKLITKEHKVASLVDNKIEYVNPTDVYNFNYNGDIYKLRSQQVDLDVTMDHELYVKKRDKKNFERIAAREIMGKRYSLKKNCIKEGDDILEKKIEEKIYNFDAYLELLGIFISDGFICDNRMYLAGEKQRKIKHIYDVCEKLNIKINSSKKDSKLNNLNMECSHIISEKELIDDFMPLNVGAVNKYLPEFVWKLNTRQSRILLESLIKCNGSKNMSNSVCYYTSSKKLADDVMKLSIHSGWSGSIKVIRKKGSEYCIRGKTGVLTEDALSVRINKTKNEPTINHGHCKAQNGQSEEKYIYEGIVRCIQVPSHVFMIRQNGKNVWIGNCCYTGDHEVLSENGWVNITEIKVGQRVASLVNNKLKYTHVAEVMSYDCDENIYEVKSNQVDLRVTLNHRMYVSGRDNKNFTVKEAREIEGKARHYKKNVESGNDRTIPDGINIVIRADGYKFVLPEYNDNPLLEIKLEAFIKLFGIWIAEGCVSHNILSIAAHKERVRKALDEIEPYLKVKISKANEKIKKADLKETDILNRYRIHDKRYTKFFEPLSVGAINKSLPNWVWRLGKEHSQLLLEYMILGDGHYMKNGTRRYDTSSAKLANDVQRLCLHAGFSANKTIKCKAGYETICKREDLKGMKIKSNVDSYRLTIIETQNEPLVNKNICYGKQLDKQVHYKGKVYCCRIHDDSVNGGIIYVRRNGLPVWCGNSRNGQKGTIGLYLNQSDMPFSKHGITPDIILNACCIPGRMTIAQILETVLGKSCAIRGLDGDGTPFNDVSVDDIRGELTKLGYSSSGKEYLYNGMTGQKIKTEIFIGPTYYLRLKHLVEDKFHSRARGPLTVLMRQPPEGRARDGGLRLGEMERDSNLSHGISRFLKQKLCDNSDAYTTHVCDICGLFAQRLFKKDNQSHASANDLHYCAACKNYTRISKIMIPYAFKLVLQEMMSMNIAPRIRVKHD